MLEKLEIKNFQSHKESCFNLSSSVNTIQGNSDCGKSAIIRGLSWLIFNPAGDYFISDWARKNKTILEPCEITIEIDGHKITRKRDKDFNGYILDGEVFEATRNSVPPQISKILNLSEVNIHRQLDAPFLLSMSSGDASRYINKLVNLTQIDRWTTASNSRARKLQQEVGSSEERFILAQQEVDKFSFVPYLEKLSDNLNTLESSIAVKTTEKNEIEKGVSQYKIQKDELSLLPDIKIVETLLSGITVLKTKSEEWEKEMRANSSERWHYREVVEEYASLPDINRAECYLKEAEDFNAKMKEMRAELEQCLRGLKQREAIVLPNFPDKLFTDVQLLTRWKNIKGNLEANTESLKNELGTMETRIEYVKDLEIEMETLNRQLSKTVCPMCGRGE